MLLPLFFTACALIGGDDEAPKQLTEVGYGTYRGGALVAQTDGVPKEMGLSFGFRVKVANPQSGPVKAKVVTVTPGLIDPSDSSKPRTTYVSEVTFEPGQDYDVFFTFSEPWEMATGHWELRVETEKGQRLSRIFDVYNPGQ